MKLKKQKINNKVFKRSAKHISSSYKIRSGNTFNGITPTKIQLLVQDAVNNWQKI